MTPGDAPNRFMISPSPIDRCAWGARPALAISGFMLCVCVPESVYISVPDIYVVNKPSLYIFWPRMYAGAAAGGIIL